MNDKLNDKLKNSEKTIEGLNDELSRKRSDFV